MVLTSTQSNEVRIRYTPYGAAREAFERRDRELLLSGPAGTGKSFACLFKVHIMLSKYPGARGLLVRKTLESLKTSGLVTYTQKILHPLADISFFGGNAQEPPHYRYPNGSKLMLGGMDKPKKVMSTEYDVIYVQEATELTEEDWESLTTRLRNGVMPYQQLIADCNPDAPTHWLKQRCDREQTRMLHSRHEDNPTVSEEYLDALRALTGVRRTRLYEGIWGSAEGQVYEEWNPRLHIIERDAVPPARRMFAAVDWGFTNPGVIGLFAEDGDGRLYLMYEYYMTHRTIDWWITAAKGLAERFRIERFVCDPSEPAYITQFVGAGLPATPANNAIAPGINAVQLRLKIALDGKPRLFLVRDALVGRDEDLVEKREPWSTAQEFDSYVWPKDAAGRAKKEKPVDAYNHGLDMLRYAVAYRDLKPSRPFEAIGGGARPVQVIRQ